MNGYDSPENFYPKYGVQGHRQPGSYRVVVDASNSTKYAFIALDGTLHLGSKGIFSFFGDVHNFKFDKFTEEINAVERAGVDAFFLFGHYPTSALLYSDGLRFLAAKSIAYFCGHLHTFVGLVPQMYSYHHSGMLELELADWKKERM